MSDQGQKHI